MGIKKTGRGGARKGAGRKPIGHKKALGTKVDDETHEHLDNLVRDSGVTKVDIVQYAIKRLKKVPNFLKKASR